MYIVKFFWLHTSITFQWKLIEMNVHVSQEKLSWWLQLLNGGDKIPWSLFRNSAFKYRSDISFQQSGVYRLHWCVDIDVFASVFVTLIQKLIRNLCFISNHHCILFGNIPADYLSCSNIKNFSHAHMLRWTPLTER